MEESCVSGQWSFVKEASDAPAHGAASQTCLVLREEGVSSPWQGTARHTGGHSLDFVAVSSYTAKDPVVL